MGMMTHQRMCRGKEKERRRGKLHPKGVTRITIKTTVRNLDEAKCHFCVNGVIGVYIWKKQWIAKNPYTQEHLTILTKKGSETHVETVEDEVVFNFPNEDFYFYTLNDKVQTKQILK